MPEIELTPHQKAAMEALQAAWPGTKPFDLARLEIYLEIVDEFEVAAIKRAAHELVDVGQRYWPDPALLKDACKTSADPSGAKAQAAAGSAPARSDLPRYNCGRCDSGWVRHDPESLRPCESCRPELFKKWSAGGLGPRGAEFHPVGPTSLNGVTIPEDAVEYVNDLRAQLVGEKRCDVVDKTFSRDVTPEPEQVDESTDQMDLVDF